MMNVAYENDTPGIGDATNDLIAAILDGSAELPLTGNDFTPIEVADGTNFDGDDDIGISITLTDRIDAPGIDESQAGSGRDTTGTGFNGTGSSDCSTNNTGTGCGSVRFNGTGITSLTFRVDMIGSRGDGDELEMRWSFPGSSVIVRKQSVGGTGTFPFTTSGALTPSFTLATTAQNTPVLASSMASAVMESKHTPPAVLMASSIGRGWLSLIGKALMAAARARGSRMYSGVNCSCNKPIFTPSSFKRLFRCELSDLEPLDAPTAANTRSNDQSGNRSR